MAVVYSLPNCQRCKIVKSYLDEQGLAYEDIDAMGPDKKLFNAFYRDHRPIIRRTDEGIEFPIYQDGETVRQGVGGILAWLQSGTELDLAIGVSELSHGWIDGIDLSVPNLATEAMTELLTRLKNGGLQIQVATDGANPDLLAVLLDQGLIDRLVFRLLGPAEVYSALDKPVDEGALSRSLALATKAPEYNIFLEINPVPRPDGEPTYLTPEECGRAAALVAQATGSKKHPFLLRPIPAEGLEPLTNPDLFKRRTACRRYVVTTDIEK